MRTLTLTLPDSVQIDKNEVMMMIAARLYERAVLSLGQAAELAGRGETRIRRIAWQLWRFDI